MSQTTYQVVVNRYEENIEWVTAFDPENVVVYDKSRMPATVEGCREIIPRRNVGREGETFMHHVVANYDRLPEYLVFLQGHPFDHCTSASPHNIRAKVEETVRACDLNLDLDLDHRVSVGFDRPLHFEAYSMYPAMRTREYYRLLFGSEPPDEGMTFVPGAQYVVPRSVLLSRPREFYARLQNMLLLDDSNSMDAHETSRPFDPSVMNAWMLERVLMYVFTHAATRPGNPAFVY